MIDKKTILVASTDEAWQGVDNVLQETEGAVIHNFVIEQQNHKVEILIENSPGGAEEGGYELTRFNAKFNAPNYHQKHLKFSVFPRDILGSIGILLGMQHVVTGYEDFDKDVVVQCNDEELAKKIFQNEYLRKVLQNLSGYTFKTVHNEETDEHFIELQLQTGLKTTDLVFEVYSVFYDVLQSLNPFP